MEIAHGKNWSLATDSFKLALLQLHPSCYAGVLHHYEPVKLKEVRIIKIYRLHIGWIRLTFRLRHKLA